MTVAQRERVLLDLEPHAAARGWQAGVPIALFLILSLGCGDAVDPRRPANVVAEVSPAIQTVVTVSWQTDAESIGFVEYGATDALGLATPLEATPAREHRASLLGLRASTPYYYRVVSWDGVEAARSGLASVRTGDLPEELPVLVQQGEGHDQFTLVPIRGETTSLTVIDPSGAIVWYHVDERELDIYRARLSSDGGSLVYNAVSPAGAPADGSELVRVSLDGSSTSSIPVPLMGRDFVELGDGTLGAIVAEYRDVEGASLRGDGIVEVAPDGAATTVWSAWSCFDPALVPGGASAPSWTGANALDYDVADDAYYVSLSNLSSIAKVNRASGACEWVLGSIGSSFEFARGSVPFLHQEQFRVRGDRVLVLDAGSAGEQARVLEYQLDVEARLATQVWSYMGDDDPDEDLDDGLGPAALVLGEPTRFDDGGTFINWSAAGRMERSTAAGVVNWRLATPRASAMSTSPAAVFGFSTLAARLYPRGAPLGVRPRP